MRQRTEDDALSAGRLRGLTRHWGRRLARALAAGERPTGDFLALVVHAFGGWERCQLLSAGARRQELPRMLPALLVAARAREIPPYGAAPPLVLDTPGAKETRAIIAVLLAHIGRPMP